MDYVKGFYDDTMVKPDDMPEWVQERLEHFEGINGKDIGGYHWDFRW